MKEYKLLKKYPSLPTDWEVGMKVGLGDRNYGYSPCAGNYSDCRKLDNSEVENNSEYWELIVPKDYEILSFTDGVEVSNRIQGTSFQCLEKEKYKIIRVYSPTKCAYVNYNQTISSCSEVFMLKNYKIHSVKRLSDNEVFTIKDKYRNASGKFVISNFSIQNNRCMVEAEEWGSCFLSVIEKVKEAILTTYDGVEIFERDVFYCVDNNFNIIERQITNNKWSKDFLVTDKIFAKKENAEEYIKNYRNYKTVDGKQIKEGDIFYIYDNKYYKCVETQFGHFTSSKWDGKRYRTKEEVEGLIDLEKPQYSLQQVEKSLSGSFFRSLGGIVIKNIVIENIKNGN